MILLPLLLASQDKPEIRPNEVISMMIRRYSVQDKLSADLKFTQRTAGVATPFIATTVIQLDRPERIYIRQSNNRDGFVATAIADGKWVTYRPLFDEKQVFERQGQSVGVDVWRFANRAYYGRTPVMDVMFSLREHLQVVVPQWASMSFGTSSGKDQAGNWVITGDWRPYGRALVTGRYTMVISPEGEFLRFTQVERVAGPDKRVHEITSTTEATTRFGKIDDPSLFRVSPR